MLRYYAIATVIVLAVVVAVTAYQARDLIRIRIAGGKGEVKPKPQPTVDLTRRHELPWRGGDVPWVLSALPDCLRQTLESSGGEAYVRAHLPPQAEPIAPPATIRYGPCTISIVDGEAYVKRGIDRFHIPPHSQFYRLPHGLALLRTSAGYSDLRLYEPATER